MTEKDLPLMRGGGGLLILNRLAAWERRLRIVNWKRGQWNLRRILLLVLGVLCLFLCWRLP